MSIVPHALAVLLLPVTVTVVVPAIVVWTGDTNVGWAMDGVVAIGLILLVEERGLLRRFGSEYEAYRANVPRWIPRLRPWSP